MIEKEFVDNFAIVIMFQAMIKHMWELKPYLLANNTVVVGNPRTSKGNFVFVFNVYQVSCCMHACLISKTPIDSMILVRLWLCDMYLLTYNMCCLLVMIDQLF